MSYGEIVSETFDGDIVFECLQTKQFRQMHASKIVSGFVNNNTAIFERIQITFTTEKF